MYPDQPAPVPGLTREQAQRWAAAQPADDARVLVGDSPERAAVVAGLRALAGYLAANPSVPIPPYGWDVLVHAEGTDSEQFSQVDLVSEIMGERPVDQRASTGHHHAERSFGPVTYRFAGISEQRMAQHQAWASYADSVVPDEPAAEPARLGRRRVPRRPGGRRPGSRAVPGQPPGGQPPRRPGDGAVTIRAACRHPAAVRGPARQSAPLRAAGHRWPVCRCGPGLAAEVRP